MVRRVYAIRYPKRYRDWFSGFTGITIQKETHKHKDHATSRRPQQTTFNATVCMRCRLLTVRAVVVWSLKIDRAVAWLCYGQMFIDQGLAAARHSMLHAADITATGPNTTPTYRSTELEVSNKTTFYRPGSLAPVAVRRLRS